MGHNRHLERRFAAAVFLSLSLVSVGTVFAQRHIPPEKPSYPGEVLYHDVCEAAIPPDSQGNQFQWNPDSDRIAYFHSLPGEFGLRMELDEVDAAGAKRTVLLHQAEVDKLFPATPTGDDEGTLAPPPRKTVGFEWGPGGTGLLLHSNRGIFWLDHKTLKTRSLVNGKELISDVQLSPDGHWAAFIRDHNLWVANVADGSVRAITKGGTEILRKGELDWLYPTELGTKHGYAWSPDSTRIAYLEFDLKGVATYTPPFTSESDHEGSSSQTIDYPTPGTRNPVVRVLISSLSEKALPVVFNTGKETDVYLPRLQWLPDSKQVAVERLSRPQDHLDLLIADAHTGLSRVVVSDKDTYWINLTDTLYFMKNSRQFIWSSERSGFRHLYLYGLDGKLVTQLTDGQWEVTSLNAVDESHGKLYYTSTEKSALERHLYEAGLDGKGEKRISGDSGTHEAFFAPDLSAYVDNFSTAVKPWVRTVYRVDQPASEPQQAGATASAAKSKLFVLDEPPVNARKPNFQPVDFLTIKTHDGISLNAMMIRPANSGTANKHAAIVYINGSPGHQAVRDAWDGDVSMYRQMLAQHGYVVFTVDNRGTSGRGHAFEEYTHFRFEGQEMTDQKDAVGFLKSLPYVDPARVGIWGRGFGGALAVNGMLHPPIVFKAAFAVAPVVNWMRYDSAFTERYLGDPVKNQDGYLASSPLDEWQRFKGPMLVAEGLADLESHPDQTMELQKDLVEKQHYVEITLYPGQSHIIAEPNACVVLYRRATDFFASGL